MTWMMRHKKSWKPSRGDKMAHETATLVKATIISLGMMGVLGQPALAKHAKMPQKPAPAQSEPSVGNPTGTPAVPAVPDNSSAEQNSEMTARILNDAIELCQFLADNRREVVDALEAGGWSSEIDYNSGNAPFYKELSANLTYDGVGNAEIWGFIEDYPGYQMGYCSLTIPSPEGIFDLSPIDGIEGLVGELILEGEQSYGAWRNKDENGEVSTKFIHAYQNLDTFLYQVSLIRKLDH